jgi:hypothetical protein
MTKVLNCQEERRCNGAVGLGLFLQTERNERCILRELASFNFQEGVRPMFRQSSINHSSQQLSTNPALQNMVVDLEQQQEESLSGGNNLLFIILYSGSSQKSLAGGALQRLQKEFAAELAT